MRLLIVEDDQRLARQLKKGLDEQGHSASLAFDGLEGLEAAQFSEFDVLVLDVMPLILDPSVWKRRSVRRSGEGIDCTADSPAAATNRANTIADSHRLRLPDRQHHRQAPDRSVGKPAPRKKSRNERHRQTNGKQGESLRRKAFGRLQHTQPCNRTQAAPE